MQYTRLTREERFTIAALQRQGLGVRRIATALDRSPSTVSRELKKHSCDQEGYSYSTAQASSQAKRTRSAQRYGSEVWAKVEKRLQEDWSPEQITGYYRDAGEEIPSHEWIYQHLLKDQDQGGELFKHLRHPVKSYRKRGAERERRGRIPNQIMIDERPKEVEEKQRLGDWELDTVIGAQGGHVLVTMVERKSRYTLIRKATRKGANEVGFELFSALREHPDKVLTLTADNGKEFAHHQLLADLLNCSVYFAHPYHSWERGLNENTNGLIRQYFPKKMSLNNVSDQEIQRVQDILNSRPRKCLGFKTPNDIFKPPQPVALAT